MHTIYRSEWYPTISEIPVETWASVSNTPNLYFDPVYLKAIESTNQDNVDFHYLIIFKGMEAVAQASGSGTSRRLRDAGVSFV